MPKIDSYDVLVLKSGLNATSGSQVFKDYSDLSHTISVVGNTQHSTTQYKFAPASIKFDGSGDSLTIPHHTGFDLGTGDFTIDWWEYLVAFPTTATVAAKRVNSSSYGGFLAGYHSSANVYFYVSSNGANWYNWLMGSVSLNTWTHFAVTRQSGNLKVYKNGVSPGNNAFSSTIYNQSSAALTIGETGTLNGYIEELRISKGIARWNANFTPPNEAYYRFLETSKLTTTALADLIATQRFSYTALADLIAFQRFSYTALADFILQTRSEQTGLFFQKTLDIILPTFFEFSRPFQTGTADIIEASRFETTGLDELAVIEKVHSVSTGIQFENTRLSNVGLSDLLTFSRPLEIGIEAFAKIETSHTTASGLGFESSRLTRVGLVDVLTFSRLVLTESEQFALLRMGMIINTGLAFEASRLTKIGIADLQIFSRVISTEIQAYANLEKSHILETGLGFESSRLNMTATALKSVYNRLSVTGLEQYATIIKDFSSTSFLEFSKSFQTRVGIADLLTFSRILETEIESYASLDISHTVHTGLCFENSRRVAIGINDRLTFSRLVSTDILEFEQIQISHETATGLEFLARRTVAIGLADLQVFSRAISTEIQAYASLDIRHAVSTGLAFESRRSVTTAVADHQIFSRLFTTEVQNYQAFLTSHTVHTGLGFSHSRMAKTAVAEKPIFSRISATELERYAQVLTSHEVRTGLGFESRRPVTVGIAQQLIREHQIYTALERFTDFQASREVSTGLAFEAGRQCQIGIADLIGKDYITYTALADLVEKSRLTNTELEQNLKINHVFEFTALIGTPEIQVVTNEIYLIHHGKRLEILSVSIKTDRDSYCYSGDAEIALEQDFAYLNENDEITLRMNGIDYAMIIDSLGIDRQGSSPKSGLKVELLSTTCRLDDPRSDRITKVWPASNARAVCEEMADQVITWDFLDWMIPAGALAVTNATRIEVIKQVIQNRAMIQTRPDGTIRVQAWYPTPPALWELIAPATILTDVSIISHSRKYAYQKRWNAVQIGDTEAEAEIQCDIEEEFDDKGYGVLRLYPTPWQAKQPEIVHTGNNQIIVGSGKPVIETICEQIEFKDGKASVAKPIYEMVGIEWLYANLAPITTQVDSKEITAATQVCYGYSVARVKYRYRYWEVPVSAPLNSTTQFLALV